MKNESLKIQFLMLKKLKCICSYFTLLNPTFLARDMVTLKPVILFFLSLSKYSPPTGESNASL